MFHADFLSNSAKAKRSLSPRAAGIFSHSRTIPPACAMPCPQVSRPASRDTCTGSIAARALPQWQEGRLGRSQSGLGHRAARTDPCTARLFRDGRPLGQYDHDFPGSCFLRPTTAKRKARVPRTRLILMKISLSSSHLSIIEFPTVELPKFTLVTGENGTGKTHLLQALVAGALKADCAPNHRPNEQVEIRLFDWTNMVPQDTGAFSSENIRQEKVNMFQNLASFRQQPQFMEPLRVIGRNLGLPLDIISDVAKLASISVEQLEVLLGSSDAAVEARGALTAAAGQIENNLLMHFDPNMKAPLKLISEQVGRPIVALVSDDLLHSSVPSWGRSDLFQQAFARLFVAYRDLYLANELAQFQKSKGMDVAAISNEEFTKLHGPPPWDFVNATLESAGLDFKINSPDLMDYTIFIPILIKCSNGITINFQNLSSGEKILMSFAFCVYYAQDRRQMSVYPKLLLFDEVDAPLHPSMTKTQYDHGDAGPRVRDPRDCYDAFAINSCVSSR